MNGEMMKSKDMLWPASLGFSTIFGCLALACIFPFAAFAALAALTLKSRDAVFLLTAVWVMNQAVGFFILSFPWDAQAVGHGIAIFAAMILAYGVANGVLRLAGDNRIIGTGVALVAAFAVQQLALRVYAGFGGGAENFSAEIIIGVGIENVLWFAGLMSLRFIIAHFTGQNLLRPAPV